MNKRYYEHTLSTTREFIEYLPLRGVEISRYRLRKKLGLGEGENLPEFLQKFSK